MKIFDCFMYFDEDLILDVRLNYLNKFVDQFVIVESVYSHNGEKRKPQFDIKKFKKFENKITYLLVDHQEKDFFSIKDTDTLNEIAGKKVMNALKRENYQRNFLINGLIEATDEDWIIISDLDEIPNLEMNNLKECENKIVFFKQIMIYYKLNLYLAEFPWIGSKACKKSALKSPQWLRNIKDRRYNFFRFDTFFSKTKYMNIKIINNGGWHFTNLKNAKEIEYKLKSYLHHREFDVNPISYEEIKKIMNDKIAIYDLSLDKKTHKIGHGKKLQKYSLEKLPKFLQNNINYYQEWMD